MSYKATNWAYDLRVASPMKPVVVALAEFADEEGSCFPGQQRIADMTGLSVRTVARALVKLEALGLISRQRRVDAYGHRTSDRYRLHLSVTMPETLPDTLPTRQRAYKAHSPSLPDTQSIPTGHGVRGTTREPSEEPSGWTPQPFCSKHPGGTTRKCTACGDARRAFDSRAQLTLVHLTPTPRAPLVCDHGRPAGTECPICADEAVAS